MFNVFTVGVTFIASFLILVAIQCLESTYGLDSSDEQTVAKYQVQKHLLDIFNAQLNVEVSVGSESFMVSVLSI